MEAFTSAADGKATKIIIPSNIQNLAGLVSSFAELNEKYDADKEQINLDVNKN